MADKSEEDEPSLLEQTITLGRLLKGFSDRDPAGVPSQTAATAFHAWLESAGPTSRQPRYFADIAENFEVMENSNKDLFRVFELLHPYIEAPDEGDDEGPPSGFIGLPMVT